MMALSWQVNNGAVCFISHAYNRALECMNINYFGTMNLTEKLPLFKESVGGACIINMSSLVGFLAIIDLGHIHWFLVKNVYSTSSN